MPFLLPPESPLRAMRGRYASCGLLGGAVRSLNGEQRQRHLEYHARTCDDAPGKLFTACPICRPLRHSYVDVRIEEGSTRWFWFVDDEHELGAVGEPQDEVLERLLNRSPGVNRQEPTAAVVLDVPDDQVWAQIRVGAGMPGARAAADALEHGYRTAVRWIADRESAWLLERYSA